METTPRGDALTSRALREFANYKTNIQNRSKLTVDEYLLDLRIFFKFIIAARSDLPVEGEQFDSIAINDCGFEFMSSVTADEIYDYMSYLRQDRGISPRSAQRKLSAVKSLYKFAVATGKRKAGARHRPFGDEKESPEIPDAERKRRPAQFGERGEGRQNEAARLCDNTDVPQHGYASFGARFDKHGGL